MAQRMAMCIGLCVIQDEFDEARDLFKWNQRFFSLLGVWPLQSTYGIAIAWIAYIVIHISLQTADLFSVIGNLELVIQNLIESSLQVSICIKLIAIRFSRKIGTLITRVTQSMDGRLFESSEEKEVYLGYNRLAKTFFKLAVAMGASTASFYYLKPMKIRIAGALRNESVPYMLAVRYRLFFEMNDVTYYLVWLCQAPVVYFCIWHTASIGLLFSLVLHVCGQLAVLSLRIRNLESSNRENQNTNRIIFQDILKRHRHILKSAKDINDVFGLILLEELCFSTLLIGLTCYAVLVNVDSADSAQVFSFSLYGATMLLMVYVYCAAGEYLVTESTNLYSAYYQCLWYDMPDSFKKQMLICMIGASKPIQLTASGIYIFSLVSFISIVKTAAGYVSMLRTMI